MSNQRLWLIFCFAFIVTAVIGWRLFTVQVLQTGEWKAQAQGQQRLFTQVEGSRGNIYLRNGTGENVPVASSRRNYLAYISPRELRGKEDREGFASEVASLLSVEKENVLEVMEKDNRYEILKRNLSKEELEGVRSLDGLHLEEEVVRYYPEGELAAHLLGFVGGEGRGQYGIEQFYENIISGRTGIREGLKNPWGLFVTGDSTIQGANIHLTVDYNIQHFTERALERTLERVNATRGSVIVGDPSTGEILAIANRPVFDPNNYMRSSVEDFKNQAVQETYEPGSVFKPITMAVALENDLISPEDTFYDKGSYRIHGRTIYNYARRSYGEVNMTEIMEQSINTGMVHVQSKIENELFLDYLKSFKFFEPTNIDLHGEVYSPNRPFLQGHDVNFATASYGHGIEVTPVQFFRAFSAIANGGRLIDPYVAKDFSTTPVGERVISPSTSTKITEMLVSTVENGFGSTAKIPGYHIAGKTGTAQIPWSKLGISRPGYSDQTIQGFAGYAPAFDPEFVILVKVDEPQTRSAEVSAAPLFKEVAEYILEYKKIPPDYDASEGESS